MIYLFYLIIFYTIINNTCEQSCDSSGLKKFDADVARLMTIGNYGRKFPETKGRELKVYCNESYSLIQEIDQYKLKCLKDLPRQVTGVLVYAVKNTIKQYCRKDSQRLTELINGTPCINAAHTEITGCYNTVIDSFQGIKYAPESKRIPHMCCEYYKIFSCIHEKAEKVATCSYKKLETAADFIRSIFNNIVDLICGDYVESSDKCDRLESPPLKRKSDKRTKSFAMPMIDILDSFPEVY